MRGLRHLFVIAGIATLMGVDMAPAIAQADNPKAVARKLAKEREVLKLLRKRTPATPNAKRWVDAFIGEEKIGKDKKLIIVKRPQFIGPLFSDYSALSETNRLKIIAWVETIARGLIVSGDGEMFMILASHHVRHEESGGAFSAFSTSRSSLGQNISDLGANLSHILKLMPPQDQRAFKISFARAIAGTLVNHCDAESRPECSPTPDLPLAIMGYRLFKDFAQGSGPDAKAATAAAIEAMHQQLGRYSFTVDDVSGLLTPEGLADLKVATSSYLSPNQSPLMMLMEMGIRTDWKVGETIRRQLMMELQPNGNAAVGLTHFIQTYDLADQQTRAKLSGTLAQQMTAREWQRALGMSMNMTQVKGLYEANYLYHTPSTRNLFIAALQKSLTPQEAAEMPALFAELLQKTAANPEAYYRLMDDFKTHEAYQQALASKQKLNIPQIAAHFDFLAGMYVYSKDFNMTLDSNLRLMDLMREYPVSEDSKLPVKEKAQMQKAFRATITKYVGLIGSQGDEAYQLAKLVQTANNTGWSGLIDDAFIKELKGRLAKINHPSVLSTLDSVIEVNIRRAADKRRLDGLRPSIFDDAKPK